MSVANELSDSHDGMADEINRMAMYTGNEGPAADALNRAIGELHASANAHLHDVHAAHNHLQIAAEHVKTAASLADWSDKYFGRAVTPGNIVDQHVRTYKHEYLS